MARRRVPVIPNGEATITIVDANVSLATFQNGVNGYIGNDAMPTSTANWSSITFGQDPVIRVDQAKGTAAVRPQQGFVEIRQFVWRRAATQVPMGSQIFDAFLTLNVSNAASGADIRILSDAPGLGSSNNATWESPQGNARSAITNGVTPDGFEASAKADAIVTEPGKAGKVQIPLNKETIQSWANGSLANFGWSIISTSPSLWQFNSSEGILAGTFKPELTILYTDPVEVEGHVQLLRR